MININKMALLFSLSLSGPVNEWSEMIPSLTTTLTVVPLMLFY